LSLTEHYIKGVAGCVLIGITIKTTAYLQDKAFEINFRGRDELHPCVVSLWEDISI
jgi:hypothetical protein